MTCRKCTSSSGPELEQVWLVWAEHIEERSSEPVRPEELSEFEVRVCSLLFSLDKEILVALLAG